MAPPRCIPLMARTWRLAAMAQSLRSPPPRDPRRPRSGSPHPQTRPPRWPTRRMHSRRDLVRPPVPRGQNRRLSWPWNRAERPSSGRPATRACRRRWQTGPPHTCTHWPLLGGSPGCNSCAAADRTRRGGGHPGSR
eukprot:scaffold30388_cov95-Isochrysis_galbana.AAC.2